MIVKQIVDEDFVNYKKPSMFIAFPSCDWKCEKECGKRVCQNGTLANSPNIEVDAEKIVTRYMNNALTNSIVVGGLEPFDDFGDLLHLIMTFRRQYDDDIVIYTGYTEDELHQKLRYNLKFILPGEEQEVELKNYDAFQYIIDNYKNIIVKFGRFVPNQESHYDEVLGVMLASDNQYAKKIC